jgi:hypothetical protein
MTNKEQFFDGRVKRCPILTSVCQKAFYLLPAKVLLTKGGVSGLVFDAKPKHMKKGINKRGYLP